jgi:hypothetical protein
MSSSSVQRLGHKLRSFRERLGALIEGAEREIETGHSEIETGVTAVVDHVKAVKSEVASLVAELAGETNFPPAGASAEPEAPKKKGIFG